MKAGEDFEKLKVKLFLTLRLFYTIFIPVPSLALHNGISSFNFSLIVRSQAIKKFFRTILF